MHIYAYNTKKMYTLANVHTIAKALEKKGKWIYHKSGV